MIKRGANLISVAIGAAAGVVVGIVLTACAHFSNDASTHLVGVSDDGKTVGIEFEANATTGYSWTYTMSCEGVLEEKASAYLEDEHPDGMVGVGGTQRFVFGAVGDGEVTITFTYAQPWEPDGDKTVETRTYRVSNKKITEMTEAS